MIKLVATIQRRSDWSREDWLSHYAERHGPLTASVHAFTRHSTKYIQNYVLSVLQAVPPEQSAAAYDGVSELWFADVPALLAAYAEPEYMDILRPDELRFNTFETIKVLLGTEHVIDEGAPRRDDKRWAQAARCHTMILREPAAGITNAALQAGWRDAGAVITADPAYARHAHRYVQTHAIEPVEELPGACAFGLIDEFWTSSADDALALCKGLGASSELAELEAGLTVPGRMLTITAQSHLVYGE